MQSTKDLLKSNKKADDISYQEFLQLQANNFNKKAGTLEGYECPICKNKGKLLRVLFNERYNDYYTQMCECECNKKRKLLQRAIDSGLGEYVHKKFEDYIADDDWQKVIKQKAGDYIKANDDKWFIALGQSGSGKTLICSIIARHLLATKTVMYITWTDFISKLKRDMMGDNTNEVTTYLDSIKKAEVLFIDELLKKFNDTDLKYIIEIINYRYTNNLKTIITSERTLDELLEIDEATFSRVIEMCGSYISFVPVDRNKNYRLRGMRGL